MPRRYASSCKRDGISALGRDQSIQEMAGAGTRGAAWLRTMFAISLLAASAIALSPQARAQDAADYPNKPVKLVVPYATGGVSDTIGRILANAMSQTLGQPVIVENRGGGGGTVGAGVVAKSAPDGYTILLTSPPMVAVAPVLLPSLPYNATEDFTPIGTFVTTPNILVVNSSLPVNSLADLARYAKGRDDLSYGSAGPGSTGHLLGHILTTAMGIKMTHVPYKSSGAAFPDVIAGRVSMVFDSVPSTIGHVRGGGVRPIVVMSEKRSAVLPDVPTTAEAGYPAATLVFWMALEGPAKIPAAITEKLNAAMRAAVETPAMREQLAKAGAEISITSPKEFDALRRRDIERLGRTVKEMGLKPE